MIPIKDDNPTEIFPLFTLLIIGACVAAWVLVQGAGMSEETLTGSVCALGAIPSEITGQSGAGGPCTLGGLTWGAIFSSMFLHGGWFHLIGNMWFLWIFGNNIEDSMGRLRFLVFYLITGAAATLTHVLIDPDSAVPLVGASGAISGIMGAYLVLYPHARVITVVPLGFFLHRMEIPAWVMLGYWFLLQAFSAAVTPSEAGSGGVAFWAHVGGFVAGVVLVKLFERRELVAAKRAHVRLPRERIPHGGWF